MTSCVALSKDSLLKSTIKSSSCSSCAPNSTLKTCWSSKLKCRVYRNTSENIHIADLDKTITGLNDNVSTLKEESSKKTETINDQDAQLNTAWFVFGTKKELKEQRILDGSKVLQANFNKSYFTKIDIRVQKEIKLYSKSAKILTMHPSSSYTLQQDANKQYVLRISNPQLFWSTSKYLVIQVKK